MAKTVINEHVNIDIRPAKIEIPGTTDISIGDLHANPIKLLYFLVRHGICDISAKQYARLVEIYRTPQSKLTKGLLNEYNAIVANMTIINHDILVRLIGDELTDRGNNDYFVLKILQKLAKDNAKTEILLSNHGVEFIEAYERFKERGNKFEITMLHFHAPSLGALADLVKRGLVDAEEIFEFVDSSYKPALKAISYTLDPSKPGITIFSHAGIGLQSIKALAKKFGVEYQDRTDKELAATIDNINKQFAEAVNNNDVHRLLNKDELLRGYDGTIDFNEDNALEIIMWNRKYNGLDRPTEHNGYPISFAHGHDKNEATKDNIYVLDCDLGKAPNLHEHTYISLVTDEIQLPSSTRGHALNKFKMTSFAEAKSEFLYQLKLLAKERDQLSGQEQDAATTLYLGLKKVGNQFFQHPTEIGYIQFKNDCNILIKKARSVLDTSCGWKQILGNIALAILGIGIFYLTAICYNKATTGRFLFFPPTITQPIDAIETVVNQPELAPSA